MSRDTEQPGNLARWLEQPPGTAPPDLDDDVLEAIIALRPERAPAPRVTADDILASVTTGPLAGPSEAETPVGAQPRVLGGEVVPFPAAEPDASGPEEDEVVRKRPGAVRWLAWAGGTGGVGLALVAAATLLVVATPAMWQAAGPRSDQEMNPAAAAQAPVTLAAPDAERDAAEPAAQIAEEPQAAAAAEPARSAPRAAPRRAPSPAPSRDPAEGTAEAVDALPMGDGNVLRDRSIIPEALEASSRREADKAGLAEADDEDVQSGEVAPEPAPDDAKPTPVELSDLRGDARPPALTTFWRDGLDGDLLGQVEAKVAQADAASGAERGRLLEEAAGLVGGTARQVLAVRAAEAYQAAGAYQAAEGISRVGLAVGSSGLEGAWLSYLLGVSLEAQGRSDEAASAYREAVSR